MQRFTSKEYLKIDIASNYGLDKKNWDERIAWFDEHESNLMDHLRTAEEPALYYAGIKAWEATQRKEPTGYMISLDATSSGIQILSCLTGDFLAATLCNVLSTGSRENAYTKIYQMVVNKINKETKLDYDDVKQAIMTAFYTSKAVPKMVFGEGELLTTFYETLKEVAPGAWELNEAMLALWNDKALSHNWILPDNFHVHIKVMNQIKEIVHFNDEIYEVYHTVNAPIEKGRSLGANLVHSIDGMIVREITRRCDYDPAKVNNIKKLLDVPSIWGSREETHKDKMVLTLWNHYNRTGYLSARIIDYLVADNMLHVDPTIILALIESFPAKPFKVVSIHDCFRVHPNYGNDLREQYNRQLMLIARSTMLSDLLSQITEREIKITKLDPDMYGQIMLTDYALS